MHTTTHEKKVIGHTYQRDRFEVQTRSTDKDSTGDWRVFSRNAKTLAEANAQIAEQSRWDKDIRPFIDLGRYETRVVKVTASCEVVA